MSSLQHRASAPVAEDWVDVQKKTFTRWANSYLVKRKTEIGELVTDLADGTRLAALLEVISNERLNKINATPKIDIQKLENLNKCIQFLKDKEIQLVNIGSQDILKGNLKLILGLLWTIILRFEVGDQEGKNGLLLWVQRSCKGYKDVDPPNVQNFTGDWNTGLPFCAIIHRYRPDLLDYDSLRAANAADNCELAFSIAESKLGIARLLDVSDVAGHPRPDEKSIVAYVSQFFKLFAKASKNDALIKSIRNAVEVTKRHDQWLAKYEDTSRSVAEWVNDSTARMSSASGANTTDAVKAELEEFTSYMRTEKPQMQSSRAEVEGIATQLLNSKRNNKRPPFVPDIPVQSIGQGWEGLEQLEQEREAALLDKYGRFQQVDNEYAKFAGRAASMKTYLDEQTAKLSKPVPAGLSLTQLESEVEALDGVDSRLAQYGEVAADLQANAAKVDEFGRGEHAACAMVAAQSADLADSLAKTAELAAAYRSKLTAALAAEKELVEMERSFKRKSDALDFELDQLETLAKQAIVVSSAADVASLTAALEDLKKDLGAASGTLNELTPLAQKLASRNAAHQKHAQQEQARVKSMEQALKDRETLLKQKLAEETARDALRTKFANQANQLAPKLSKVGADLGSVKGELEKQLEQVRGIRESLASAIKGEMETVDAVAVECDQAGIVNNPKTPHTIFSLHAQYNQLVKAASDEEQSLNAQILAKQALEVSPEQIKELHEVFAFFDENKSGTLGLVELKEACMGAGIDLAEDEIERRMREKRPDMKFNLEDFTAFMLAELKAGDTIEHVVNAFKQIGDGSAVLTPQQLDSAFQTEPDLKTYIVERMPDGDFQRFTEDLFSR